MFFDRDSMFPDRNSGSLTVIPYSLTMITSSPTGIPFSLTWISCSLTGISGSLIALSGINVRGYVVPTGNGRDLRKQLSHPIYLFPDRDLLFPIVPVTDSRSVNPLPYIKGFFVKMI